MCQISKKSLGSGDTLAATFGRSGSPVETKQKQRRQWCRPVAAPSFFLPRQVLWAGLLLLGLWFPATSRLFVFPWLRTCASRSGSRCLWSSWVYVLLNGASAPCVGSGSAASSLAFWSSMRCVPPCSQWISSLLPHGWVRTGG